MEMERRKGLRASVEYDTNRQMLFARQILALPEDSKERAKKVKDLLNGHKVNGGGFEVKEQEKGRFRVFGPNDEGNIVEVTSMDTRNDIVNTLNDYTILAFGDQKQLSEKRDIINVLLLQDEIRRGVGENNENTEIYGATGVTGATSNITGGNVR